MTELEKISEETMRYIGSYHGNEREICRYIYRSDEGNKL